MNKLMVLVIVLVLGVSSSYAATAPPASAEPEATTQQYYAQPLVQQAGPQLTPQTVAPGTAERPTTPSGGTPSADGYYVMDQQGGLHNFDARIVQTYRDAARTEEQKSIEIKEEEKISVPPPEKPPEAQPAPQPTTQQEKLKESQPAKKEAPLSTKEEITPEEKERQRLLKRQEQAYNSVKDKIPSGWIPLGQYGGDGSLVAIQDPTSGEVRLYNTETKTWEEGTYSGQSEEEIKAALDKYKEQHGEYTKPFFLIAFANSVAYYYRQYSGLAGWSSLVFDEEFLQEWRDTTNKVMCDILYLPTKECWTSKICEKYVKLKPTRNGVLYSTTTGKTFQATAHIEGQRSLPLRAPNGTAWVYTVTFGLNNPTDEGMGFNVRFVGSQRSATWWAMPQKLGKGGSVSAIGAAALYKMSAHEYTSICLEFDPSVSSFGGKRVGKMCNPIAQYSGEATAPYGQPNATTTQGPGAPQPAAPPQQQPGASV